MSKKIEYIKEGNKILLLIDNELAGHLQVSDQGCGEYNIEYVLIEKNFRGKGFYKCLLIRAFSLFSIYSLTSFNRNCYSNPIYENWTGEDLDEKEYIYISIEDEKLVFTLERDL